MPVTIELATSHITTTRKTTSIAMVMGEREREWCGLPGTRLSNRGSFYLDADSRGELVMVIAELVLEKVARPRIDFPGFGIFI